MVDHFDVKVKGQGHSNNLLFQFSFFNFFKSRFLKNCKTIRKTNNVVLLQMVNLRHCYVLNFRFRHFRSKFENYDFSEETQLLTYFRRWKIEILDIESLALLLQKSQRL